MKIALAQISVEQSNFSANLKKIENFAKDAKAQDADIVVFPEMCVCGFNYRKNLQFLKTDQAKMLEALSAIAKNNKIHLAGTVPFLDENEVKPFNRFFIFDDNGETLLAYDKLHLFSPFNENRHCALGKNIALKQTKFGKIGLAICYDLRFGELFRELTVRGAEIILLSAAWPHPRFAHWDVLTKARAIENQVFVVAVNQCGIENFGDVKMQYFGASRVIAPDGKILTECETDKSDTIAFAEIDIDAIPQERMKIPVNRDRRTGIYDKK